MSEKHAVYGGSFDPPTWGHLHLIRRAARLYEHLTVGVGINRRKLGMFSIEERVAMLREELADLDNVTVASYDGLLVDFCREVQAGIILRGLRAIGDFEYEFQMGLTNMDLAPEIESVFMIAAPDMVFVSSSVVKEIASCGRDIRPYVPEHIAVAVEQKIAEGL